MLLIWAAASLQVTGTTIAQADEEVHPETWSYLEDQEMLEMKLQSFILKVLYWWLSSGGVKISQKRIHFSCQLYFKSYKSHRENGHVFCLHIQCFPYLPLGDANLMLWTPSVQSVEFYPVSIYLCFRIAYTHPYHDTEGLFSCEFDLLIPWSQKELHKVCCKDSRYHITVSSTQQRKGKKS